MPPGRPGAFPLYVIATLPDTVDGPVTVVLAEAALVAMTYPVMAGFPLISIESVARIVPCQGNPSFPGFPETMGPVSTPTALASPGSGDAP